MTPAQIAWKSSRRVWWKCPKGPDHEWQVQVHLRARGNGCPFCANRALSVTNALATLWPRIADEWHAPLNGGLTPAQVVAVTYRKVWWKCDQGHVWKTMVRQRTVLGSGCPVCRYRKRRPAMTAIRRRKVWFPGDLA